MNKGKSKVVPSNKNATSPSSGANSTINNLQQIRGQSPNPYSPLRQPRFKEDRRGSAFNDPYPNLLTPTQNGDNLRTDQELLLYTARDDP
jgi:hypothetical protein